MIWEILCPNLSFTAEYNMMNKIFHFLKFHEFHNELGKICFPLGKNGFWSPLEILRTPHNF